MHFVMFSLQPSLTMRWQSLAVLRASSIPVEQMVYMHIKTSSHVPTTFYHCLYSDLNVVYQWRRSPGPPELHSNQTGFSRKMSIGCNKKVESNERVVLCRAFHQLMTNFNPMFQLPFSTFRGEDCHEVHGFVAIRKSFSAKFGGVAPLAWQKQTVCEHFLQFFTLESFPVFAKLVRESTVQ